MTAVPATEQALYTDQNVHVSTSRLIIHGTTYALSNVTSVRMLETPPNRSFAITLIVLGVIFLGIRLYALALIALAVGILLCVVLKATYSLAIGSASGERSAMSSKDRDYIAHVVESINEAIIARG